MNSILNLIFLAWLFRILLNLLSYIQLWWVKEYRWDRMIIHLRTPQGKLILFPPLRKPPLTPKSISLFCLTLATLITLFWILPGHLLLNFITVDLLSFPVTWIWVGILIVPTLLYHRYLIDRSIQKLRNRSTLKVIGITGSFGKTSTKENLATIISSKFKTLKTEGSKNSPIAIAEILLAKMNDDHEVFVVEMAAYKRGEIAEMSDMVKPQVGIITAINPQHLDLFGSIENTMKAKYELIKSLPKDGIAIFNADNPKTLEMAEWAKNEGRTVWAYTTENRELDRIDLLVKGEDIEVRQMDVRFNIKVGTKKEYAIVKLLGKHQVSNILAAMSGALAVGMSLREITSALRLIVPFKGVMEPIYARNGTLFINDTFNNNPDAAKAAINYLSLYKGKKILVFQPMVELGEYAKPAHEEVGICAGQVCDEIILTNHYFFEAFYDGVKSISKDKKLRVMSSSQAADLIEKTVSKNDAVLFKGKEAENVLRKLHV